MSWVTVIWSMIASACLTLGVLYAFVWYKSRANRTHLLFAVTAVSTAVLAFCESSMMRAQTPVELAAVYRWAHVPLFFWVAAMTWFVALYLQAPRRWLAWIVCGLRGGALVLNFLVGENINYLEVTASRLRFLGEPITVIGGRSNPWMAVAHLGGLLLLVFVADASVSAWRRGDRARALLVGGTTELFTLLALGQSVLVHWLHIPMPITLSPFYMGVVAVMAYELSRDLLRASELAEQVRSSEAGLRESEARMSLAVDTAELGIWIQDLTTNRVWASDRWRAMFGFPPLEPISVDATLARVHPDDRASLRHAHGRTVAGGEGARYQAEYRVVLRDGEVRWIASAGRLERDELGRPLQIRSACREITMRKRGEQEAQLLRQEIAHAGRVSMMGQLASALAHEIVQPLTAINSNTAAAHRILQHAQPDIPELTAIVADIRKDEERARAVIDRMRGFLQRHRIETRRLDVAALVHDVAALLRVDAATRRVSLDVDVANGLPHVKGDRVHLQQVLLNLILNGMDALNGAAAEDRRVTVAAAEAAGGVEISVTDCGPGIPEPAFAQVFEPFFTTKPEGLGMGLAISRTIIEAHGGRLWAENNVGRGAAFRFTVPRAEEFDLE